MWLSSCKKQTFKKTLSNHCLAVPNRCEAHYYCCLEAKSWTIWRFCWRPFAPAAESIGWQLVVDEWVAMVAAADNRIPIEQDCWLYTLVQMNDEHKNEQQTTWDNSTMSTVELQSTACIENITSNKWGKFVFLIHTIDWKQKKVKCKHRSS